MEGRKRKYSIPRGRDGWPVKARVDPGLRGVGAFDHPAVREWHGWLLDGWMPRENVAILTPCSNVKPYPRSPMSGKVRGVLRRLGLWDTEGPGLYGSPRGVEWYYVSDLLVLVPYERAHEYPACCYELRPEEVLASKPHLDRLVGLLSRVLGKLAGDGRRVLAYLPSKHRRIVEMAGADGLEWVRYDLFYGQRYLEEALRRVLGSRAPSPSPGPVGVVTP